MSAAEQIPTRYALEVRRIKELYFFINEAAAGMPGDQPVKLEVGLHLTYKPVANLVMLTIRAFYHFPARPPEEVLLDIRVQNAFEIPELTRFHVDDTLRLPQSLITAIVELSLAHTRAILATKTAGTVFQDTLLAVLDARELATHFFPFMFEGDTPMEELIKAE
jgi:hypothetical protein